MSWWVWLLLFLGTGFLAVAVAAVIYVIHCFNTDDPDDEENPWDGI